MLQSNKQIYMQFLKLRGAEIIDRSQSPTNRTVRANYSTDKKIYRSHVQYKIGGKVI